jgi:hypothetical protein
LSLQCLGAADLTTIATHSRIVRHVLRLEWRDAYTTIASQPAQTRDNYRLTNI